MLFVVFTTKISKQTIHKLKMPQQFSAQYW